MLTRRIRKSETDQLATLCRSDKRWSRYYSEGHQVWLKRALDDVASNDRVVFGTFISQVEGETYSKKLAACIFLKRSPFESIIELKNLILPVPDKGGNTLSPEILNMGNQLLERAIRFSEVRSIQKIEIELPQEEHSIISIFLGLNFKIVALRERYSPGNMVCILERSIGERYYGDPFDRVKLAQWLLRCFLPCNINGTKIYEVASSRAAGARPKEIPYIPFECKPLTRAFSNDNPVGKNKRLRGKMWLLHHQDTLVKDVNTILRLNETQPTLTLLQTTSLDEDLKKKLAAAKITWFDNKETREIAGGSMSSLSIPFDDVGGVVTVLEQEEILK